MGGGRGVRKERRKDGGWAGRKPEQDDQLSIKDQHLGFVASPGFLSVVYADIEDKFIL